MDIDEVLKSGLKINRQIYCPAFPIVHHGCLALPKSSMGKLTFWPASILYSLTLVSGGLDFEFQFLGYLFAVNLCIGSYRPYQGNAINISQPLRQNLRVCLLL